MAYRHIKSGSWFKEAATQMLERNRRTVKLNGKQYTFHCPSSAVYSFQWLRDSCFHAVIRPSSAVYPFQWLWDSCFHAVILAKLGDEGIELAKKEMRSLFSAQHEDGFVPHIIFWFPEKVGLWDRLASKSSPVRPQSTEYIQPPVFAHAINAIWESGAKRSFLEEITPKALRAYRWLKKFRDPDDDGLITIIAPFESGMDYNSVFDRALGVWSSHWLEYGLRVGIVKLINKFVFRYDQDSILRFGPFGVVDVLTNSIFIQGLFILGRLLEEIGDKAGAEWAVSTAQKGLSSLLEKSYDPQAGAFWNFSARSGSPYKTLGIGSMAPLIIEQLQPDIARMLIERHLLNPKEFWSPYPFPSISISEPTFSAASEMGGMYEDWRGGGWCNINWFFYHAFQRLGYGAEARILADKTKKVMYSNNGFWESWNPLTGQGLGAYDFGWSALVLDMP